MTGAVRTRTLLATATVALAVVALVVPLPARAAEAGDDGFLLGRGSASGSVLRARVYYAGLSIPVPIGLSASAYELGQSQALGAAVSASAAGSLTGVAIDGTAPVSIDSNAGDKALDTSLGGPPRVAGTISLRATRVPASRSDVRLADVDLPGIVRVEGGRSRSSTEVTPDHHRVATASVDIASVTLAGGLVGLQGLHWEVSHRTGTGGKAETQGRFSVGDLVIAGVAVPLGPAPDALAAVLALVNATLAPIGLSVTPPVVQHLPDGSIDVGSLRVTLANSPLGVQLVGPLLATVRPLLLPAIDAAVAANPSVGLASLLLDLGLGVADGSGGAEVSVGGVNAETDDLTFGNALAVAPAAPALSPPAAGASASAPLPALGPALAAPSVAAPAQLVPAAADVGPARCVLAASPRRHGGCRTANETAALVVVGGGLAALAVNEVLVRRRRRTLDGAVAAAARPSS